MSDTDKADTKSSSTKPKIIFKPSVRLSFSGGMITELNASATVSKMIKDHIYRSYFDWYLQCAAREWEKEYTLMLISNNAFAVPSPTQKATNVEEESLGSSADRTVSCPLSKTIADEPSSLEYLRYRKEASARALRSFSQYVTDLATYQKHLNPHPVVSLGYFMETGKRFELLLKGPFEASIRRSPSPMKLSKDTPWDKSDFLMTWSDQVCMTQYRCSGKPVGSESVQAHYAGSKFLV